MWKTSANIYVYLYIKDNLCASKCFLSVMIYLLRHCLWISQVLFKTSMWNISRPPACGSATGASVLLLQWAKEHYAHILDAAWREPALKAQHGHPGPVRSSQHFTVAAHRVLCRHNTAELTVAKASVGAQKLNMWKMEEKDSLWFIFQPKSLFFEECPRVRSCDVTRGLWVSRHVGFRGSHSQRQWEERGCDPDPIMSQLRWG